MKVTSKGRYGLRVMMELAGHYARGPMPVEAISRLQGISGKYIHLLMVNLRSAGLVRSMRGPNGGYALARRPSAITALEVVTALEGKMVPVECVGDSATCERADRCATRDVWSAVAAAVDGVLAGLTLEQLADRQRALREQTLEYQI